MQTWRDRGFVEDSEGDEEISISSQSAQLRRNEAVPNEREATPDELSSSLPCRTASATIVRPIEGTSPRSDRERGVRGGRGGRRGRHVENRNTKGESNDELGHSLLKDLGTRGSPNLVAASERTSSRRDEDVLLQSADHDGHARQKDQGNSNPAARYLASSPPPLVTAFDASLEEEGLNSNVESTRRDLDVEEPRRRNFRERKAIQLHPYLILDGKYQNEMRAAGIRPTRVITQSQQPGSASVENSSDNGTPDSSYTSPPKSTLRGSAQRRRLASIPASPTVAGHLRSRTHSLSSLPDIFTFLGDEAPRQAGKNYRKEQSPGPNYSSFKKRKLRHPVDKVQGSTRASASPPPSSPTTRANHGAAASPKAHDISPEVPVLHHLGKSGFRLPFGYTPTKPPTPATSSDSHTTRENVGITARASETPTPLLVLDRSEPPALPPHFDSAIDIGDSSSSDSAPPSSAESSAGEESTPEAHLGLFQKRIKGVLPASWLKLDVKKQTASSKDVRATQRPPRPTGDEALGVARRKPHTPGNTRPAPSMLLISSDDQEDEQFPAPLRVVRSISQLPLHPTCQSRLNSGSAQLSFFDDDPGEVMEDNTIDHMLPSASRHRSKSGRVGRKRQTRLIEAFNPPKKRIKAGHTVNVRKDRSQIQRSSSTRAKAPKRSIVDSVLASSLTPGELPQFLKIARRQAERQPDQGRQRPSDGVIRLQTREDTAEAQAILGEWRAGHIPRQSARRALRIDKQPRSTRKNIDSGKVQKLLPFTVPLSSAHSPDESQLQHDDRNVAPHTLQHLSIRPSTIKRLIPRSRGHQSRGHQAQLEAEETVIRPLQDRLHFELRKSHADREYSASVFAGSRTLPQTLSALEHEVLRVDGPERVVNYQRNDAKSSKPRKLPRRLQKRPPVALDIDRSAYRQAEDFRLPELTRTSPVTVLTQGNVVLQDLNPYGVPYARTFDILPLPAGTFFHQSTLLGSGRFKQSITFSGRDLDLDNGSRSLSILGHELSWGPWNEELASGLRSFFSERRAKMLQYTISASGSEQIAKALGQLADSLEDIFQANGNLLWFSDSVDRLAYSATFSEGCDEVLSALATLLKTGHVAKNSIILRPTLRVLSRLVCLCGQVLTALKFRAEAVEEAKDWTGRLRSLMDQVMRLQFQQGFEDIRLFYDRIKRNGDREGGIRSGEAALESLVLASCTFQELALGDHNIWDTFNDQVIPSSLTSTRIGYFEHAWFNIFTMLPLLELDSTGVLRVGDRFEKDTSNWPAVKALLSRTLELYPNTAKVPGSTMNEYIRALLARCHQLIGSWAWRQSEFIIGTIFDFFARRRYNSLPNEEALHSPRFLAQLHSSPSLAVEYGDRAFHLFLKIVAIGLRGLRNIYNNNQIRSIAWRWLPNHSRTLEKHQKLKSEDLDAVRNQHDLMTTLYWASPEGFRPRLELIQDLVDHSTSHKEACRINIKTWSSLAAFQLSADEPTRNIVPLRLWLRDILEKSIAQYKLARPELEAQNDTIKKNGGSPVSTDEIEAMILRNQGSTLSAMTEVLGGLQFAIKNANSIEATWALVGDSNVQNVLSLFDAKKKQPNAVLFAYISVLESILDLVQSNEIEHSEPQAVNEESQDYGEWPDLEEEISTATKSINHQALDYALEQAHTLLSNVFGAESAPEEGLLISVVDLWSRVAVMFIKRERTDMQSFLGEYGRHSWDRLRETTHRRTYTPYFASRLLTLHPAIMQQHRHSILAIWLESLVEREAHLKFQHQLTADLLNACASDPFLHNLPFARDRRDGRYHITFSELRDRRVSSLCTVLANMQNIFHSTLRQRSESLRTVRSELTVILKHIMHRMRRNYEDLKQAEAVTGAYVTFIQSMIEAMQQCTADICVVDKFFTDSVSFPLPAHDPTYLVGRLRGYEAKLDDVKVAKQLGIFVQSISERAVVDQEQEYLQEQLTTAISSSFSTEAEHKTTLRQTLISVIFPVYFEAAMETSPAWILAQPLLKVSARCFQNAIYNMSLGEVSSIKAMVAMLSSLLQSLQNAVLPLDGQPQLLESVHTLHTFSLILEVLVACMPILDYLQRATGLCDAAVTTVKYFADFTLYVGRILLKDNDALLPSFAGSVIQPDRRTAELKAFCAQKLQEDLRDRWSSSAGHYFVKKGNTWKEIFVDLGGVDEERARLIGKIEDFHFALATARGF